MHTLLLPSICAMSSCNVHADESTFSEQFTSIDHWTHWKFPLPQTLSVVLLGTRSYSVEKRGRGLHGRGYLHSPSDAGCSDERHTQ